MIKNIGDLEKIKGEFLPEIGIREDTDVDRISEKPRILVCGGTGCVSGNSDKVVKRFTSEIEKRNIDAKIITTGCHGFCEKGPLTVVCPGKVLYTNVKEEDVEEIIEQHVLNGNIVERLLYKEPKTKKKVAQYDEIPFYKNQQRIVLRNCGLVDPENIEEYIARDGYFGLGKALGMTPEEVIEEVKISNVRGRGGAGFPAWRKWKICHDVNADKKYIIANGDEGDPGAFMDRSLMEGDPHSIIEGMIIAGYAIGANEGYIYVRAEYPLAVKRLRIAIGQAEEHGLLGENIFGKFSFKLHLNEGAGAFVCGEETALIASIEGKRGFPNPRPPFPAVKGLFGKPLNGGGWYSGIGTKGSTGTKIFALTGSVNNTGLIEVPMGITFREIIFDLGGGILGNREFKAVQTGGPSGGCLPKDQLDLEIDFDSLARAGSIMGSGGLVVMDENTCAVDVAKYFLDFTRKESCGKCTPCREGTTRMHEIIERMTDGEGKEEDIPLIEELGKGIVDTSMCALGKTAPNPVLTTLRYFGDEYIQHIKEKKCVAGVCTAMLEFSIDPEKCKGCLMCIKVCPSDAITGELKEVHVIDAEKCIKCGSCYDVCKLDAVKRG
jgi:NADH:ubiquinone oxidoreductase subunit F (NADH-binding)/(2Fe-2S) ferredoxin/NAD-dependent dihydropyrimidine dehydrogenase PreA subunit